MHISACDYACYRLLHPSHAVPLAGLVSCALSLLLTFVTRDEFSLMMLVRLELIAPDDLRRCQEVFDKLDILKTGRLDARDLKAWNARRASVKLSRQLD